MIRTMRSIQTFVVVLLAIFAIDARAGADQAPQGQDATAAQPTAGRAPTMADAIASLEARLDREPNDVDGWVLLGRSYQFMQRDADAARAFSRAKALGYAGELPEIASPQAAAPAPAVNPHRQSTLPPAMVQQISEMVHADGPAPAPVAPAKPVAAGDSAWIEVQIRLARPIPGLAPETPLFVFVRSGEGDSRMPLAVTRQTVGSLPLVIRLSQGNTLMPADSLMSHASIIVGARIARSGSHTAMPGDIEALSGVLRDWQGSRVALVLGEGEQ